MENLKPGDTDMLSPPSDFHSSATTISTSATTITDSQQHQQARPQRSKGTKTTVNDGYIYHPYEEYSQTGSKNSEGSKGSTDSTANDGQASATRILELRGLERRIIQLLETAGQAIQILAGEDDPENAGPILMENSSNPGDAQKMIQNHAEQKSQEFQVLAAGYATLVNEIQSGLRRQFHYLTKAGIASSQVPFKNVVYGEEKELETWLNAVDVLKESTDGLIEKVEREFLDIHRSSHHNNDSTNIKEVEDESSLLSSTPPAATTSTDA